MALFKKPTQLEILESERQALLVRRDVVDQRLRRGRLALTASHTERRSLLLAVDVSDTDVLAGADENCRRSGDHLVGLEDASVAIAEKIVEAQRRVEFRERPARAPGRGRQTRGRGLCPPSHTRWISDSRWRACPSL